MTIEIALDVDEEWDSRRSWEKLVRTAAEAAIDESAFAALNRSEQSFELSVTLTSDEEVRALNRQWRAKDSATNVLSFPMLGSADLHLEKLNGAQLLLGDIVLAKGICAAEASDRHTPLEDHAAHLLVHGTLHLLAMRS